MEVSSALASRKVVLFDAGGTLITLDFDCIRQALGEDVASLPDAGLEGGDGRARRWADGAVRGGASTRELWDGYFSSLLRGGGFAEARMDWALDALRKANREDGLWRRPIPGARELLARLRRTGRRLAVVSNAEGQVEADLRKAGLADDLEVVIDSFHVGVAKPDPRIFEIALERLGVDAQQAVYVGDVPAYDVDGARAAGIAPILIDPYGIHPGVDVPRLRKLGELAALLGC